MNGGCGLVVVVAGETPPAVSVAWEPPTGPFDSGYSVIFSDADVDVGDDELVAHAVCLHCLVQDGDEQLGRGLDLARRFGQVDFDVDSGAWFQAGEELG